MHRAAIKRKLPPPAPDDSQKQLTEIKCSEEGGNSTIFTFSYNDKNQLASVTESSNSNTSTTHFSWEDNAIIATENGETITYTLSDNLVRKQVDDQYIKTFTYNSSNQLTRVNQADVDDPEDPDYYTYDWSDSNMMTYKRFNSEDPYVYEYTYSDKICKGWFPNMEDPGWKPLRSSCIFFVYPELVGMRTAQLTDHISYKETDENEYYDEQQKETCKAEYVYEEIIKFDYILDKDGYIESCTITETDINTTKKSFSDKNGDGIITDDERNVTNTQTHTYITVYTFKWE